MDCNKFSEAALDLAAGLLSEKEAAEAAEHMKDCPECAKEYENCLKIAQELAKLGEYQAPESLLPNVMKAVSDKKRRTVQHRFIGFAAAAVAAVLIGVGVADVATRLQKDLSSPAVTDFDAGASTAAQSDDQADFEPAPQAEEENTAAPEDDIKDNTEEEFAADMEADNVQSGTQESETYSPKKKSEPQDPALSEETAQQPSSQEAQNYEEFAQEGYTSQDDAANNDNLIQAYSLDAEHEESGGGGSSGGSASSSRARITSAMDEEEREFIFITVQFHISEENAALAADISTIGKSRDMVAQELDALGVEYKAVTIELSFTQEYETASDERKAQIEEMCARENVVIIVETTQLTQEGQE